MEFDDDPARHCRVLAVASAALAAAKHGDSQAILDRITEFVALSPDGYRDLGLLISLLVRECGTMVTAFSSTTGNAPPIKVEVRAEDGRIVPIDELAPPVRTTMRALLAEAYGDSTAADTHIDLALSRAHPRDLVNVVLQAVWVTRAMAQEFDRRGLRVVDWVQTAID